MSFEVTKFDFSSLNLLQINEAVSILKIFKNYDFISVTDSTSKMLAIR